MKNKIKQEIREVWGDDKTDIMDNFDKVYSQEVSSVRALLAYDTARYAFVGFLCLIFLSVAFNLMVGLSPSTLHPHINSDLEEYQVIIIEENGKINEFERGSFK